MLKIRRHLVAILTIVTLFTTTFSTTAMAADLQLNNTVSLTATSTPVDNTFTMGSYHRGGDRAYSANKLYVTACITDTNGNPVNSNVVITLKDYNGNFSIWYVPADGELHGMTFYNIVANRIYYFTYERTGEERDLKLHIIITPVN